jgi:hypothetical protein
MKVHDASSMNAQMVRRRLAWINKIGQTPSKHAINASRAGKHVQSSREQERV